MVCFGNVLFVFIISMIGVAISNYSVYKMQRVIKNHNPQYKVRRFFSGSITGTIAIFKFLKIFINNKDPDHRNEYLIIIFYLFSGLAIVLGSFIYFILCE